MELRGLRVESFQCRNHPEREGVGICVACKRVFCVECSTKIDGVNHCRECLSKRAKTAVASETKRSGAFVRLLESVFTLGVVACSLVTTAVVFLLIGESSAHAGAKRTANRDRVDAIATALRNFQRDTGKFPTEAEGLKALHKKPKNLKGWHGPYLDPSFVRYDQSVVDSYGQAVQYRAPTVTTPECAILSTGADRRSESDLANAKRLPTGDDSVGEGDDVLLIVQ